MLRFLTKVGKIVNERSATMAYKISGSPFYRVAEAVASLVERQAPSARRARRAIRQGDAASVIVSLAAVTAAGLTLPEEAAAELETRLGTVDGRRGLSDAAADLLPENPDAPFLLYLRVLGLLDAARFEEAHELVSAPLNRLCAAFESGRISARQGQERAEALIKLWQVVDWAARDQMRWIVRDHGDGAAYARFEFIRSFEALPGNRRFQNYLTTLAFAEPLLQGKKMDAYLLRCEVAFGQAQTLYQRLQVVRATIRQGIRRVPDYGPAYEQAREFYNLCRPEMEAALERWREGRIRDMRAHLRWLRLALSLALQIGERGHAELLNNAFEACADDGAAKDGVWIVASTLAQRSELRETAERLVESTNPKQEQDLRDFYQFSLLCGQYERAHAAFARLPKSSRTRQSALGYASILQRSQRFSEAEALVRAVHARLLSNTGALDPFVSYGLIRRTGELRFASDTARYYESVPQPSNPSGVVIVAARNFDQLRRTPIVTLLEWKRRGWAVVPIVEGMLPLQKTGIEAIDRFAGCIRLSREFRRDVADWMTPVERCNVDFDAERLTWRDIDLSHSLWEEAAISRRVYDVVWSCPSLQRSLKNLVEWTEMTAGALESARKTFGQMELRCGTLVLSSFRLPDAVVRFYCNSVGDPHDFFCIQSTNGYENYFVNFQKNVSNRLTMRNMTAHAAVRTSSMPLASQVVETASKDAAMMDRSTQFVLQSVRSKPQGHVDNADRQEAVERIARWKASGGRIACAFGKLVCDSGVPFDGGPAHSSMRDWVLHTIESVKDSATLLLVKPHPHELRQEIACFLNQMFRDLLPQELPDNVLYLGHDWFETHELEKFVDLTLIYNGTSAVEMSLLGVPTVLAGYFGPVDYPLGQAVPTSRDDYRRLVRFEREVALAPDGRERAAAWLSVMASDDVSVPYRYHSRQITNCAVYPPFWFPEDINGYLDRGDPNVSLLVDRAISVH